MRYNMSEKYILTKGRIARGRILLLDNVMRHRPIDSIAVLMRWRCDAVIVFCSVQHSSDWQCFSMGRTTTQNFPFPRISRPHLIPGFRPTWVSPQTASRSVHPFLHSTSVWSTHRHTESQTDTHTTLRATSVAMLLKRDVKLQLTNWCYSCTAA